MRGTVLPYLYHAPNYIPTCESAERRDQLCALSGSASSWASRLVNAGRVRSVLSLSSVVERARNRDARRHTESILRIELPAVTSSGTMHYPRIIGRV